jgi:hypothetical protein
MKNIHLLPTEKPSRLFKFANQLHLDTIPKDYYKKYQIYITSDEEIKEGVNQWYLDKFLNKPYNSGGSQYSSKQDVIILTTDQDLIKDGVQPINDNFLEWFVKNPSCEFVEIRKYHSGILSDISEITSSLKIIIPKEEPKQETLEEYFNGLYKQSLKDDVDLTFSDGVKLGAKWQAERMYSEEELKNAIEISVAKALGVMSFTINEESFEQFKKK